jgi:hypothetical protein
MQNSPRVNPFMSSQPINDSISRMHIWVITLLYIFCLYLSGCHNIPPTGPHAGQHAHLLPKEQERQVRIIWYLNAYKDDFACKAMLCSPRNCLIQRPAALCAVWHLAAGMHCAQPLPQKYTIVLLTRQQPCRLAGLCRHREVTQQGAMCR